MEKTLNNLTFLSKGDDWFWDNDENGMTYFIYDRNHDLHDAAPEQKRYQLIMTPQSEIGNILTLNIIPDCSSCVLESDDCDCMNSWANNMSDGLFPVAEVPEQTIQYESMKQFIKARSSSHMTESDNNYLFEKALKAYHTDKQNLQEYLMWDSYNLEETECPKEYENSAKFMEGAGNIAANVGAGGAGALVMQLMKNLGPKWQAIGGISTAIVSGIAKYFGTAASVKHTDEYKNMVAEGKSKEAGKFVTSKALKSAAQAVAAAGAGALASKFLPGLINKVCGKKAVTGTVEDLTKAAQDASKTNIATDTNTNNSTIPEAEVAEDAENAQKAIADKNYELDQLDYDETHAKRIPPDAEELNPPPLPKAPELPTPDKMDMTQLKDFNVAQYKDFLAKDPNNLNALLSNSAIATSSEELSQLNAAGAFDGLSYNQMGQLRNAMRKAGIDTSKFQGLINAKVSPTLKGAQEFTNLDVKQDAGMLQKAGLDKYLTNQYVTADQNAVLNNASNQGFTADDLNNLRGQIGQVEFKNAMGQPLSSDDAVLNFGQGTGQTNSPYYHRASNTINYKDPTANLTGKIGADSIQSTISKFNQPNKQYIKTVDANGNITYTGPNGKPITQKQYDKILNWNNSHASKYPTQPNQ